MEQFAILFGLVILALPLGLAIWLIVRAVTAARRLNSVEEKLRVLETTVHELSRRPVVPPAPEREVRPVTPTAPEAVRVAPATPTPAPAAPPVPPLIPSSSPPVAAKAPAAPLPRPAPVPSRPAPSINWEQFMGVKLFAWIGGFALFLGLVFFLKYAFENKLISPEVQVAGEYLVAIGLLVGGVVMHRKQLAVLMQTLCATGVLMLYAVTFAAHSYYNLIGIPVAFTVMTLITIVAFLLAVRLDGQVIAVLGLLGGFLTPILLSTGKDNPLGLFTFIGLIDAGLIAVVSRKRWNYLMLLAAIGTVLMQLAWVGEFFRPEKVYVAMGIFLSMEALFLAGFVLAQKRDETDKWITTATAMLAAAPLVFTLDLLTYASLGARPGMLFTFVLAADLGLLMLATLRAPLWPVHLAAGGAVFLILSIWTVNYLTDPLLNWALGFNLLFAILHSVYPVVRQRVRPGVAPAWWAHLFPVLALALVLLPIFKLPEVSFTIWFCVLLLDLLVFGLAIFTGSILAIIGALVLTLVSCAAWVLKIPADFTGVPDLLVVIGGFALLFFAVGIYAARKIAIKTSVPKAFNLPEIPLDVRAQIPALSAILPFLLLIMVALRLPMGNPSPVFGLAMLLVVLLLGVARATAVDWLVAIGLVCTLGLEYAWHETHFKPEFAVVPLAWYLAFYAVFTVFPFMFRKTFATRIVSWATAALAGPLCFRLVFHLVNKAFPNPVMGLLPAAFAIPSLISLVYMLRTVPAENPVRLSQLAWFGGATLFFITLIFPIQFDREWITIGWALEGMALLWLFHRVPHPGLRLVGVALLVTAFTRLALNPAVLEYHARSTTPILNWYLYTYGIATVCLMVGGKLLAPPRDVVLRVKAPPILFALGTVLAFLLLNIEIADYFSTGSTLTFDFRNNLPRDMTYSIAWALFALGLLAVGIWRKLPAGRYASIGLLLVTLLKLFFHDLKFLNQLYRVGAIIGVAIILLLASFFYQRFLSTDGKAK